MLWGALVKCCRCRLLAAGAVAVVAKLHSVTRLNRSQVVFVTLTIKGLTWGYFLEDCPLYGTL